MLRFAEVAKTHKDKLLTDLTTNQHKGLDKTEAAARLLKYGENLIKANQVSFVTILLRQFKSPFIFLLFGASILSFVLGEIGDALFVLVFITINTILGFYQEYKSESVAKLLKSFVESQVKVFRSGEKFLVSARNIVPGDIIELLPGDIVQADMRLINVLSLAIDESILTGESEAQLKDTKTLLKREPQLYEAKNIAFSGSTVVSGYGLGVAFATGENKEISSIAKLVTETSRVSSFEKGIASFSKFILKIIGITLILMIVANFAVKGFSVDVPQLLLFSVALAVAVIPEALPVVTTFSLSQGANRLAKKKVVVKRLTAIEDLGSISVLCTDKTGTITQNKMTLVKTLSYKGSDVHYWASLASDFLDTLETHKHLDAFDEALLLKLDDNDKLKLDGATKIESLPFDPERKRASYLVELSGIRHLISKGAPESVLELCKNIENKKEIEKWITKEGFLGNRIMAVCRRSVRHTLSAKKVSSLEQNMDLVGFLSFSDPLKPSAIEAVYKAKSLGVQIKVLTGDRPEVAGAIGVQVGLITDPTQVLKGETFIKMTDSEKMEAVIKYNVFARVTPQIKYQIIEVLQKKFEVGFLGEGINDAPALKVANVGIVVQSASDISKESADILLLNRSLLTIVEGIEEGRKVFSNTVKYIKATLASNFGNFYAVAISTLFIPFLPMLPIQILLVNLLSDFPMISIATDNVDPEDLASPRSYEIREVALSASAFGFVSTIFDFLTFALFFRISASVLQTNWFMESILTELILLYSIRTKRPFYKAKRPSKTILILTLVAATITVILPQIKLGETFGFIMPSLSHILTILVIVLMYFVCTEIVKLLLHKLSYKQIEKQALV